MYRLDMIGNHEVVVKQLEICPYLKLGQVKKATIYDPTPQHAFMYVIFFYRMRLS